MGLRRLFFYGARMGAQLCKWTAIPLAILFMFALYANLTISAYKENVYTDISATPKHNVGLVLGTSRNIRSIKNPYYENRLNAAAELYNAGKVAKLIVSGDGSTHKNCEPEQMREDLILRGVNESDIVMDYAGFRTLDSITRCKAVFGVTDVLIISQDFHCRRALFIAERNGISADAFAAHDISWKTSKKRMALREFAARTVALADTDIIHRKPKFYGEQINVHQE